MRAHRRLPASLLGLVVAVGACRGAAPAPATVAAPSAAAAPTACGTTVQGVTAWREVEAEGFRFCVPSSWRAAGRTWQHGGASISWGVGSRPARQATTMVVSVPASELGALQAGGAVPDSDVRRFSETIDGRRANMWRNRFGREFHTGAEWSFPRVWLVGDARDAATADLQVAIFRTVRFSAR